LRHNNVLLSQLEKLEGLLDERLDISFKERPFLEGGELVIKYLYEERSENEKKTKKICELVGNQMAERISSKTPAGEQATIL